MPSAQSSISLRLRVRVWAARVRLDQALAAGADPDFSPELTLRAAQLCKPRMRRSLAAMLSHLLDAAEEPPTATERQAPARAVNRAAVAQTRAELITLVDRLRDDQRGASCQALAQANRLVTDGRGPLYGHASAATLAAAIKLVHTLLDSPSISR